ncbi:error-prone DNA polymerase [Pelomonas saccharophila]|uniref:Error-prone DNA polymerase n=1 Tax=Roseateles saccharophilus TaxID=304 RepID=A0ABU1YMN3_ROSSA|nr:error-prone DNA polymerase [Roseateles saccharophilus]MDR7270114.1 error-prone DNA polymerase [Roseateles saccharophilus]
MADLPDYAELRCISNFSFLEGASWPQELVERAKQLGYSAIAITDMCSMAGVVRAHVEAKAQGLTLLVGCQFAVTCDFPFTLVVLACNLNGYGNLCQLISKLRRRSEKGTYEMTPEDVTLGSLDDCVVIACPTRHALSPALMRLGRWLLTHFTGRVWLGLDLLRRADDEIRLLRMREISAETEIPLVAVGNVTMHQRSRRALLDVMTATRIGKPLTECGRALDINAERHLRTRGRLARTFPADLLEQTLRVAEQCDFSLDEIGYQYPAEVVPEGETAGSYLRKITYEGAGRRWPNGIPATISELIERELGLIEELKYEHYFLTVADIVMFARREGILCQGRGSAANSVVCYACGITEVDPARMSVLFERFISKERNEPPDIDVDFEHERREEVIQHIYRKYGRDRAALTAVVISYRVKSALKDVGKALGFELPLLDQLSGNYGWWDSDELDTTRVSEVGIDVEDLSTQQLIVLTRQILSMPRHMSQHPGGFVLTQGPLSRIVPIENASMDERTIIQWDKDDIDVLGLLKVDVLALGMLTAVRKALAGIGETLGYPFSMQDIPAEDPATYDMICEADTVGTFQIESRAQRSMLPRMRPVCFYDLVIEVAIVRPGPIVGNMVHPYLRRRQGKEEVTYPSKALEAALGRTLGVPLFQEQVMQVAMIAAGYTGGEADALRRDMAAWKRKGGLKKHYEKIVNGMAARGYDLRFAEDIFKQIEGFSEYGFPESHAASFALIVYVSCWIKRHYPAHFLAAIINSQPMGFYQPAQLVRDARRHGVEVLPVDVMYSDWDCKMEPHGSGLAVRLGLRLIDRLTKASAEAISAARQLAPFDSAEDLAVKTGLNQHQMTCLAAGDALMSLSGHRRQQVWDAAAPRLMPALLQDAPIDEDYLELEEASEGEAVEHDYASTGLTLRSHPLALLRKDLEALGVKTSADLEMAPDRREVYTAGIVVTRQQPETANGTVFISLEDEHGDVQVICHRAIWEKYRQAMMGARLMGVKGRWQRADGVCNLIAGYLEDRTDMLGALKTKSRNFH